MSGGGVSVFSVQRENSRGDMRIVGQSKHTQMAVPGGHVQTRRLALVLGCQQDLGRRHVLARRERRQGLDELVLLAGPSQVYEVVDLVLG